ncbi:hypothetical protein D6029_02915 [Buttiauxella izardii]|uniref:Uncharacterized protein n=1 Tax=Buttiauxella izardii TaxID=82991 RepID=A0A3A5JY96_9ENTR|nr:hypothetical protein D6029_02915 [Buttiauxella izardii]
MYFIIEYLSLWQSNYPERIYPSYFKLQGCWLHSLTPVTYLSKLLGISSLAAYLQLELFRL